MPQNPLLARVRCGRVELRDRGQRGLVGSDLHVGAAARQRHCERSAVDHKRCGEPFLVRFDIVTPDQALAQHLEHRRRPARVHRSGHRGFPIGSAALGMPRTSSVRTATLSPNSVTSAMNGIDSANRRM